VTFVRICKLDFTDSHPSGQSAVLHMLGGPESWIRNGSVTVGVHCLTGACSHQVTIDLATLPFQLRVQLRVEQLGRRSSR
jgi:hypothetical protein